MYLLAIAIIVILVLRQENKITKQMRTNEAEKQTQEDNREWKSEWTWNEETQLWEHPLSKKATPAKKQEYQNAYEATPILTQNEFRNYQTLNQAAMRKGYMVNCKVRLADIVKPRNDPQYMSRFGKIKSKHVDFVILDSRMKVRAIIELDDKTHDREDRKKRDEFVDAILQDCGYKVIHTRYITPDILDTV